MTDLQRQALSAASIIRNDGLASVPVERVIRQLSMFDPAAVRAAHEAVNGR